MSLRGLLARILAMMRRRELDRTLDEEMQTHLSLLVDQHIREGMRENDARQAARRDLGNIGAIRQEHRESRGIPAVDICIQNLHFAFRLLRRNPGFSALVVFALALGIGANSAIFSLVDTVLLRPLDAPELDRLVNVIGTVPGVQLGAASMSPGDFEEFRVRARTLANLAAFYESDRNLTGSGEPQRIAAAQVSSGFFAAMGVAPALGSFIYAAPDYSGEPRQIVLTWALWRARFAADPGAIGARIFVDGEPYRIAGVMPKGFRYPPVADAWLPMRLETAVRGSHDAMFLTAVGRLRPGVTLSQATADVNTVAQAIERSNQENHFRRGAKAELMRENISGNAAKSIMRMLQCAVGLVLLLACVNVANLQLARVSLRAREIALRFAMGAGRLRIAGQLLTESEVLASAGTAAGVLLAIQGARMLQALIPPETWKYLPAWYRLGVNGRVLIFTAGAGVLAGMVAGVAPALLASRRQLNDILKQGGRGASSGGQRRILRNSFVAAQVVLALVLLTGAELMIEGLHLMTEPAPNLDPSHAFTLRLTLPRARYAGAPQWRAFEEGLLNKARAIPGVRSAAICADLPYTDYGRGLALANPEGTARHEGRTVNVQEEPVSPDYFRTLGLPILAGRAFTEADDENGQDVAIITERMAQRWFPNRNPIGQRVKVGMPESDGPWLTIVGVARNLRTDPFHPGYGIIVFRPFRQAAPDSFSLLLRSANPSGVAGSAIQAVRALDPAQPVYDAMTLDAQFRIGLAPVRMISSLMAAFGFLALLLAATGVYSVMANAVAERTREIGIRVALGAARTRVVRSLVAESMRTAGLGIALGLPLAWLLAGLLQGMFFGVSASDPAAFTKAVSIVVASALLASFSAARRAAGIDPADTLRQE